MYLLLCYSTNQEVIADYSLMLFILLDRLHLLQTMTLLFYFTLCAHRLVPAFYPNLLGPLCEDRSHRLHRQTHYQLRLTGESFHRRHVALLVSCSLTATRTGQK